MAESSEFEKLNRIARARPEPPLPEWPSMDFLKERFPDLAPEIDAYREKCMEFFKKARTYK